MSSDSPDVGPVAQKVVNRLRRQVLSGQLTHGMELPSVRRLARMSSIGVVTANRVLKRVESEGWAERQAGGRLRIARDAERNAWTWVSSQPPPVISWIMSRHARVGIEAETPSLIEGIQKAFVHCSVRQMYLDVRSNGQYVRDLLQQDANSPCELGYVLAGVPRPIKEVFAASGAPCVVQGYVEPDLNLPCVYEDMTEVGRMAGEIMAPFGRVVALCSEQVLGAEVNLIHGLREASRRFNQPAPSAEQFYICLPAEITEAAAAVRRLLQRKDRPEGILAVRPELAMATVQAATRLGIRIPDELQLIGLHHHPMYQFTCPEITSIGPHSMVELGRRCGELLAAAMGQRHDPAPCELIESTLVERESTCPSPRA